MSLAPSHPAQNRFDPVEVALHVNSFSPRGQQEFEKTIMEVVTHPEHHEWRETCPGKAEGYSTRGKFGSFDVVKVPVEDEYFDEDSRQLMHERHSFYLARLRPPPAEQDCRCAELVTESQFMKIAETFRRQQESSASLVQQRKESGGSFLHELSEAFLPSRKS